MELIQLHLYFDFWFDSLLKGIHKGSVGKTNMEGWWSGHEEKKGWDEGNLRQRREEEMRKTKREVSGLSFRFSGCLRGRCSF